MAVSCSVIWLLIGVVFFVQLPVTRGQLCPPDGKFHALTGSCMAVIRKNFTYGQARGYCPYNFRSSTTKRDGHLVFIFDNATDDFVKGLLDEQGVDRALIGLQDRTQNGVYEWGLNSTIAAVYTGWADNPHTADTSKNAVVMTKDGWKEYDGKSTAYFVCQVSVDFPTPKMVCPVAEEGKESPDIRCTIDTNQSLPITGVRFMKTSEVVASCDANGCRPGPGYGQVVDVSKPPETGSSASWTLKLRNVTISDATGWTCSVEFDDNGYWVASQPCSLNVYRKPADIQCSHRFVQETVRTTCTATHVYPQVNCTWKVNRGSQQVNVSDQTVSNDVVNGDGYYRATCTASFNIYNAGTYDVIVAMFPTLPNFRTEGVKETSVSVGPPEHCSGTSSPKFPAAVGAPSASIKMCVRAYPAPASFRLYKGNASNMLRAEKFHVSFNFTNEQAGLGEITVKIYSFIQADIGDYTLYSEYKPPYGVGESHPYLTFSVFAQGPPMCPTNFTSVKAGPDSVTLSWAPDFDGGFSQTFTVLRIDSPSDTSSPGFTMLGTVEGQEDSSVYAVTGLSEGTTYTFGLEVRNEKGSGNCSHLQVTVSTSASPADLSGAVLTVVVVPAITVLLLVILVVVVVMVVRRRRGYLHNKSVYLSDTARTGAGDTSRAGSSGAGKTSRLASNNNGGDNLYANTATPGISREGKNVKAAKKTREEGDDSNTYAQVNKQDKKAKKARERPDKKKASEEGQESLYSRFARNINLKGHKKGNTEQVYSELADVYHVSNAGGPDTSAAADPDNLYANVKASSPNKQEKKKGIQRTVNEDGLVYVSVEINKKTTYPEIESVKKPVGTVSPMTTSAEPEVEYISINFPPGSNSSDR